MNKFQGWLKVSILAGSSWVMTACGNANQGLIQNFFPKVELSSHVENREVWVDVKASLQTGNFHLNDANLPLTDSQNSNQGYGELAFHSTPCLSSTVACQENGHLTISINLTETAKLDFADKTLPNGQPLPFIEAKQRAHILDLGQTGGKVYYITGNSQAILGLAVPFQAFDSTGKHVPGISVFEPLQFGPISALGGFFTSLQTKSTGLAFFVDLSGLVKKNNDQQSTQKIKYRPSNRPKLNEVAFQQTSPGKLKEYQLISNVSDLNRRPTTLAW